MAGKVCSTRRRCAALHNGLASRATDTQKPTKTAQPPRKLARMGGGKLTVFTNSTLQKERLREERKRKSDAVKQQAQKKLLKAMRDAPHWDTDAYAQATTCTRTAAFWMNDVEKHIVSKVPKTPWKEVVLIFPDGSGKKVFASESKFQNAVFRLGLLRSVLPEPMMRSFRNVDEEERAVYFDALPGSKQLRPEDVVERAAYGKAFRVADAAHFGLEVLSPHTDYDALGDEFGRLSTKESTLAEALLHGVVAQYLAGAGDISISDFAVSPDRCTLCMFDAADEAPDAWHRPVRPFVEEVWARPLPKKCALHDYLQAFLHTEAGHDAARSLVQSTEDALREALRQCTDDPVCNYDERRVSLVRRSCRLFAALSMAAKSPPMLLRAEEGAVA